MVTYLDNGHTPNDEDSDDGEDVEDNDKKNNTIPNQT